VDSLPCHFWCERKDDFSRSACGRGLRLSTIREKNAAHRGQRAPPVTDLPKISGAERAACGEATSWRVCRRSGIGLAGSDSGAKEFGTVSKLRRRKSPLTNKDGRNNSSSRSKNRNHERDNNSIHRASALCCTIAFEASLTLEVASCVRSAVDRAWDSLCGDSKSDRETRPATQFEPLKPTSSEAAQFLKTIT